MHGQKRGEHFCMTSPALLMLPGFAEPSQLLPALICFLPFVFPPQLKLGFIPRNQRLWVGKVRRERHEEDLQQGNVICQLTTLKSKPHVS